ncbi:MAG: ECF transporter S component [Clostridia bacterium]|nr:ECF transporter S component [Clostridia bacterium]
MKKAARFQTKRMVAIAMFAALAYACVFVLHIKVAFLTFDAKDAIITVAGLFFGPGAAAALSLLVATLELITISDTGLYGFLMNFASSATFSVLASLVYKYRKTMNGALAGLGCSVLGTTAVMLGLNLVVTPLFLGGTAADVAAMIPTLLLPFNLIKAVLNASLVLVLYKPIATALHSTRLTDGAPQAYRFNRRSLLVLILGLAMVAVSIVLYLTVLDGTFLLWDD